MSKIFVTSDPHFGHENIIKSCGRPFNSFTDMNNTIINDWNATVEPDDVVYCLGDWNFSGGKNSPLKVIDYERQLNGTIVHIRGNHDKSNKLKTLLDVALCSFGGYVFLMQHRPPTMNAEIPEDCDFVLCGHVHEKWKVDNSLFVPIINVGMDQWKFKPVEINTIVQFYESLVKEKQ